MRAEPCYQNLNVVQFAACLGHNFGFVENGLSTTNFKGCFLQLYSNKGVDRKFLFGIMHCMNFLLRGIEARCKA